jgi:WD40 repeat protein
VKTVGVLAIALVLLGVSRVVGQARHNALPADLIFTAAVHSQSGNDDSIMLVRLDAKTLTMTPFYVDTNPTKVTGWPLVWSPDGSSLAIFRSEHVRPEDPSEDGYLGQICILARTGKRTVCTEDPPVYQFNGKLTENQLSTVSWSADSKRVYFVSKAGDKVRLLEADATTGKRLNVLYEYAAISLTSGGTGYWNFLSWTPDLEYVAVGLGDDLKPAGLRQQLLHNRNNRSQVNLTSMFSTFVYSYLCLDFSPKGSYLVIEGRGNQDDELLYVLDKQGNVLHTIGPSSGYGRLSVTCPTWQEDESAFVSVAASDQALSSILRYSLVDQKLSVAYRLPEGLPLESSQGRVIPPLALSPDGRFIAAHGIDNPNPGGNRQVVVIYPDGHARAFLGDYFYTENPVWMPPQQ